MVSVPLGGLHVYGDDVDLIAGWRWGRPRVVVVVRCRGLTMEACSLMDEV